MSRISTTNSIPLLTTTTGKFCLPVPSVLAGTYVTTPFTASVTSITILDNTISIATVVTAANHNLHAGAFVIISGSTIVDYNGVFKIISVVDLVTFTISVIKTTTSPATGTIIFQNYSASGISLGCAAVGTGTLAGIDFKVGDWLYDPATNAVRQVANVDDTTHWTFTKNFPSNVSNATVQISPRGVYRGVSILNTGSAAGIVQDQTYTNGLAGLSYWDEEGLDPICGTATGTTFLIELQAKAQQ